MAAAAVLAALLTSCSASSQGSDDGAGGTPGAAPSTQPASSSTASPTAPTGEPSLATALPGDPRTDLPTEVPTARNPLADAAEQAASEAAAAGDLVLGGDISWPQCPKGMGIPERPTQGSPLPLPTATYVIVGLTNGPAFYPNPCLASQVDYVRQLGLMVAAYSVLSYPDDSTLATYGVQGPFDAADPIGALKNVGYAQARFNVRNMKAAGLLTPLVWLDVESVPGFQWTLDPAANSAVIQGAVKGYADLGYQVGVYSTPAIWRGIAGTLSFGVPEWRAAGPTSMSEALDRCGDDWVIQGGPAVLAQWVEDNRDLDTTCPQTSRDLTPYFHQY